MLITNYKDRTLVIKNICECIIKSSEVSGVLHQSLEVHRVLYQKFRGSLSFTSRAQGLHTKMVYLIIIKLVVFM